MSSFPADMESAVRTRSIVNTRPSTQRAVHQDLDTRPNRPSTMSTLALVQLAYLAPLPYNLSKQPLNNVIDHQGATRSAELLFLLCHIVSECLTCILPSSVAIYTYWSSGIQSLLNEHSVTTHFILYRSTS